MVLHSSNSRNNLDRYILNLNNTVLMVLKKKQDRDNDDELTEMQTFPREAGVLSCFTTKQFRLEGISGHHLIT